MQVGRCSTCGAPLNPNKDYCEYCDTYYQDSQTRIAAERLMRCHLDPEYAIEITCLEDPEPKYIRGYPIRREVGI